MEKVVYMENFYRNGSNYGNKSFFPIHKELTEEKEILESFLYQFYSNRDSPPKILTNINPAFFRDVEYILNLKNKFKTKILQPKSGEKLKHILLAEKNALESIKIKKASFESHQSALEKLKYLLKLKKIPERIEIYDNSHTLGKNALGVMVVADKEGLSPKYYRKFNINFENKKQNLSRIDDYYMMQEVLTRRLSRLNSSENLPRPDIIIIDGGRGQYNVVEKIISKFNLYNINLISVSKGKERNVGREIIHLAEKNLNLKNNDPLLYFIQRLRDEAHRFAITSHRLKDQKHLFVQFLRIFLELAQNAKKF